MTGRQSRRELLRVGAAAAVAGLGGVGGCLGILGGGSGDDGSDGDDEETEDERVPPPDASFNWELSATSGPDQVTIVHNGGDTLTAENTGSLRLVIEGTDRSTSVGLPFSAGDVVTFRSDAIEEDAVVQLVWEPPGGGEETVLSEYEIPVEVRVA